MDRRALRAFRRRRDEAFRTSPHSPIPPAQRRRFRGLAYFPPAPELVFDLVVEPDTDAAVDLDTSDGRRRRYVRVGRVAFHVEGVAASLLLLGRDDETTLFLPFRDATTGHETYGAGRYLDVVVADDGRARVDFNLAHNPHCAYDHAYSCPLPPVENWLQVPIRAGERAWAPR